MSRVEVRDYHYCCDKCDAVKTECKGELPYGWESNDNGEDICEDCLQDKELKLDLNETLFDE